MKYIIIGVVVIALIAAGFWAGKKSTNESPTPTPSVALVSLSPSVSPLPVRGSVEGDSPVGNRVGNRAPDFRLMSVGGESVSLKSLLGQQVAVGFWNSSCGDCINRINSFGGRVMLAVNRGESKATVQSATGRFQNSYVKIMLDPTDGVYHLYGGTGMPYVVLIDGNGIIQSTSN